MQEKSEKLDFLYFQLKKGFEKNICFSIGLTYLKRKWHTYATCEHFSSNKCFDCLLSLLQ